LLTTPLGVLALLALASQVATVLPLAIACVYMLVLLGRIPHAIWGATALVMAGLLAVAFVWPMSLLQIGLLFAASYALQELAHLVTGEPTLQSSYMDQARWPLHLAEHTLLLLPLVLAAALALRGSLLSFLVARNTVLATRLSSQEATHDLEQIRDFVEQQNPSNEHSSHWWQRELDTSIEAACRRLAESREIGDMFRKLHGSGYAVDVLTPMNEIYVTGPSQELTSDTVFYTPHIDGPWAVFPFATVYRCMVAVTPNDRVSTHFPLTSLEYDRPETYTLTVPDALAFDYNREPHYITGRPGGDAATRRINIKLHYVVYPRALGAYGRLLGRLTTWYNTRARQLFLDTIKPDSFVARIQAAAIVWTTKCFEFIVRRVGWSNLAYVTLIALASALVGRPQIFLLGTSFIHYLMYIGTFAERGRVAFGRFRRNVTFFKTLSLAQLAACYWYFFEFNPLSLALLVAGFGLATLAYRALGPERTFFGAELGFCPPGRVTAFPYNLVPHPMVVGAMVGLLGIELLAPLRAAIPWLVPAHLAFYALHLLQELAAGRIETPCADVTSCQTPAPGGEFHERPAAG
jgi:hypothetical protein